MSPLGESDKPLIREIIREVIDHTAPTIAERAAYRAATKVMQQHQMNCPLNFRLQVIEATIEMKLWKLIVIILAAGGTGGAAVKALAAVHL